MSDKTDTAETHPETDPKIKTEQKTGISPLLIIPPLLFVVLAGLFAYGLNREDPSALPSALQGQEAPALIVTPLGDLPQINDKVLRAPPAKLVNFWASWCAPCRAEHHNLMALKAEGIDIYGVNYKDTAKNGLKFLSELGNPFKAAGQDSGRQAINWGVYGVPETFVIDAKGKILLRFPGPMTKKVIAEKIRPLLKGAGG